MTVNLTIEEIGRAICEFVEDKYNLEAKKFSFHVGLKDEELDLTAAITVESPQKY